MYNYLLKNMNNFLRFYYYDYYYKDNQLKDLGKNIFKLDYFIYLKFYVMYLFLSFSLSMPQRLMLDTRFTLMNLWYVRSCHFYTRIYEFMSERQ